VAGGDVGRFADVLVQVIEFAVDQVELPGAGADRLEDRTLVAAGSLRFRLGIVLYFLTPSKLTET
jgi:hypothetical protein